MTTVLPPQVEEFVWAVRANAEQVAEALSTQFTAEAEPLLLALLPTADTELYWWVVRGLAHCGTSVAIPALRTTLGLEDAALRTAAAMALGQLYRRHPAEVQPHLPALTDHLADEDGLVRQVVADTLAQIGDAAVPALAQVLQATHSAARTRAAYALGKIASLQAAPVLFRCLNDPNYLVHTYAYEALDGMGLLENVLVTLE
jgi:HEAT repeat protein